MSAVAQPGNVQPGGVMPGGEPGFGSPTSWVSLRGPGPTVLPPFLSGGALMGDPARLWKHPDAAKIFRIPWGADMAVGRVASAAAAVTAGTVTAAMETPAADAVRDEVLVKVSGGADGELATVRVDATLDDLQVVSYAFDVSVETAARERVTKPAGVSRVYRMFWGKELDGAALAALSVDAGGLTIQQALWETDLAYVRLAGGAAGTAYAVTLEAETGDGQTLAYVFEVTAA